MAYKDLASFIEELDRNGELRIVKSFVDPDLEMTEITDRVSKAPNGGKALLFENNGTKFPVLLNGLGSLKRMCLALGVNELNQLSNEIFELLKDLASPAEGWKGKLKMLPKLNQVSSWMPSRRNGKAPCQEVVIRNPDLGILPILKCWPEDGGKFITFPMVHTKDPVTGIRNVGMYRMQVFDSKTTGMHWHRHKVGARHYNEYKEKGELMPIAVALGGDPAYTYAATAPLPDNVDEYMLAGYLRKRKVELVSCLTQDIEVPVDVDIVIEGYVDPQEPMIMEGPFGDHTGFYSLPDLYPKFHVTCISHKRNAIYPATIVGIPPMEDAYIARATERLFITPLKLSVLPELTDMELPHEGVAHNLAIVKIKKSYPGQAQKVMNALWGAGQMMLNKVLVIVDEGVDIHNYNELVVHFIKHYCPATDTYFNRGPIDVLDHAAQKMGFGGKMGMDATVKLPEEVVDGEMNHIEGLEDEPQGTKIPEAIIRINDTLVRKGIGILIVSIVRSNKEEQFRMARELKRKKAYQVVKMILFLDKEVDVDDFNMSTWLLGNNIDPNRDCKIMNQEWNHGKGCLLIDGTWKTKGNEAFERDWPNIIVSSKETISLVDKKWSELDLGPLMLSPSIKYFPLVRSGGAAVDE